MDVTINDLGFKLVPNEPHKNSNIALRYTCAMLLDRLFILTKLLEFHRDNNFIKFTPKQWLLMQLFPLQIYDKDDFCFVPKQAQLSIAIDESQSATEKYKNIFFPANPNNQT
ncbi:hypothetical protein RclHR1_05330005 [Rhizophagus clarus]|uniref:Uncharacterized protein n=1 Tax=Rhizophagus clarus TaxID=94130 RepID=A0A2Z6RLV1_9GLOM|nr:hypothetical protein RclHR1_05330005 [Rhizophagus clarus]